MNRDALVSRREPSAVEMRTALTLNQRLFERGWRDRMPDPAFAPVPESATFKYLLITNEHLEKRRPRLKRTLAEELPDSLKLVVLARSEEVERTRNSFGEWIDPKRLIVVAHPDRKNGFWARDSFPFPVYTNANGGVKLIAAQYYRRFAAAETIAAAIDAKLMHVPFAFVGGNLLSDEDGNSFCVQSPRQFGVPERVLKKVYGSRSVTFLPHLCGAGDVDEVLKPIGGGRMLTTRSEYVPILELRGYQVIRLPKASGYRSYANALLLGSTAFMPVFHTSQDEVAGNIYEGLGYRVVPLDSRRLSDEAHGSVHCMTIAYPGNGN